MFSLRSISILRVVSGPVPRPPHCRRALRNSSTCVDGWIHWTVEVELLSVCPKREACQKLSGSVRAIGVGGSGSVRRVRSRPQVVPPLWSELSESSSGILSIASSVSRFHPSPQLVDELIDAMTGMSPMLEAHARINAVMREPQHWNGQQDCFGPDTWLADICQPFLDTWLAVCWIGSPIP